MYVTTFYSFKGGVGRTMALANAAVALALRGRRVLVVDFDVEAPGLDTFDALRPEREIPGVIDFVANYLDSGQAPDVNDFIGKCPDIGEQGGSLWTMPSGRKKTYATNFNQIDWGELYEKHDGYLLLEDLKEQWKQIVQPDYVLIDSRTGYTDTGGICTRQLPNSVVIFFFPNEQNLRGVSEIVDDIRSEAYEPKKRRIELHFVMSNVPYLDDEDQILESKIMAFRHLDPLHRKPMIVHRYDSLSLLDQMIFVKDRPRSRLAREYDKLVQEISTLNSNDRDGALEYIRRESRRFETGGAGLGSMLDRENMLAKIEEAHSNDGEVLFRLAVIREVDHQVEHATLLINEAIDAGYEQPEAYLKRARIKIDNKESNDAIEDIRRVLSSEQVTLPIVLEAIRLWTSQETFLPEEITESTAVMSLDGNSKLWLAESLNRSRKDLMIAVSLLELIYYDLDMDEVLIQASLPGQGQLAPFVKYYVEELVDRMQTYSRALHILGLAYMGLGQCSNAVGKFLENGERTLNELDSASAFNYGMAKWGVDGVIETDAFLRVVELNGFEVHKKFSSNSNDLSRMAIAYWAVGDHGKALDHIDRAQETIAGFRSQTEFSYWRYLRVSASEFKADLINIRNMIEGDDSQMPHFMIGTSAEPPNP